MEPDGTSFTARENLADILAREILGPGDGPDEVLDVVPDAKYLVGLLAPVRLTRSRDVPRTAEPDEEQSDVGDDLDARAGTGVPVAAVDDTTVDADEDAAQDSPTKRGLMMPASMGLRFQVPLRPRRRHGAGVVGRLRAGEHRGADEQRPLRSGCSGAPP